jgi:hypothetical protein
VVGVGGQDTALSLSLTHTPKQSTNSSTEYPSKYLAASASEL